MTGDERPDNAFDGEEPEAVPGEDGDAGNAALPAFPIDLDSLTEEDVRELLEKARQAEENLDRLKRLQAEHENYRKRMAREAAKVRQWAIRDFVLEILPVADDLERALGSPEQAGEAALREGIRLVLNALRETLKRSGIEPLEAEGGPFDPAFHEAVGGLVTAAVPPGTVVTEILKGYRMKDVVVRPSRVLVARAPESDGETPPGARNP